MKTPKSIKKLPAMHVRKQIQHQKNHVDENSFVELVGLLLIILLGIIIYSNSFNCSFHFDDSTSIVDNSYIRNLFDVKTLWNYNHNRFVAYYSFAINYHFGQLNVWGYHLINLIVHLINSCLVYWLTLLIFSSPVLKDYLIVKHKKVIALFTALFFVSHPLATESVTYIVQRIASMAAMFYLLSIALYIKARLSEKISFSKYLWFGGAVVSGVLAMLSKENSFTLPFTIILVEVFFFRSNLLSINFKDYRVILSIIGITGFILFVISRFSLRIFKPIPPDEFNDFRTVTSLNYLFTQFSVIIKYIQLLILPINQNFDYDFPISNSFFELKTLMSFFIILLLIAVSIFFFKRNRIISFGIFWFFLTLSIESSFIPLGDVIVEHRTYLPSYGFFLILSSGLYVLFQNKYKYLVISVFSILILSNSFLTYQRNIVWKDEFSLWDNAVSESPNKARPHYNRGNFFYKEKKYKQALDDYSKAIELKPNFAQAYYNRGVILGNDKKFDLANKDYSKTIELNPKYIEAYVNRGNAFRDEARFEEALRDYEKVIELSPDFSKAYLNRGMLFVLEKKFADAINDFSKVIALKTYDVPKAYYNRGMAKYFSGNKDGGCIDLLQAAKSGYQPAIDFSSQNCH